jgi:hypothetical protein
VLGGPYCNVQSHTLLQTCCILWDFPSKVCMFEAVSCISRELCHCMVRGGTHAYGGSGIALLFAHRSRSTTQSRSGVSCSQVGPVVSPVYFWCCGRRLSFGAHGVSLVAHTHRRLVELRFCWLPLEGATVAARLQIVRHFRQASVRCAHASRLLLSWSVSYNALHCFATLFSGSWVPD